MTRAAFSGIAQDRHGNGLNGAQITFRAGTEANSPLASVYAANSGGSPLTQPISTDADGRLRVFVEPGAKYRIEGLSEGGAGVDIWTAPASVGKQYPTGAAFESDIDAGYYSPNGTVAYSPQTGPMESLAGTTAFPSYPGWRQARGPYSPTFPDPENLGRAFQLRADQLSAFRAFIMPDEAGTLATREYLAGVIAGIVDDLNAIEETTVSFNPSFTFANEGSPTPAVMSFSSVQASATKQGRMVYWGFSFLWEITKNSLADNEPLLLDMGSLTTQLGSPANRNFSSSMIRKSANIDLPTLGGSVGHGIVARASPQASVWNMEFSYQTFASNNIVGDNIGNGTGQFVQMSGFYFT